ncbi:hypothetical protein WOSG25_020020 [Weissella oryzae SG25]|uniref:Uncharacterized protein n=1 Tax=Weissella oryzae (strain DSM 25784 / JCM 18191 / LMG 30913 / SG25) TaxID=1329250 RepID=A0A069CS44_WEIOS|nr:hypothetical protein [Weissella oryzae]GAK30207.1 hypothetical protein WOSG25_020020 [Weissella oryzae SG25]
MKKNLLERMQWSNEYNRPEYFPLYANSSIVGYIKQGGKKYTGNTNVVKDELNYSSVEHLNELDDKRKVKGHSLLAKVFCR